MHCPPPAVSLYVSADPVFHPTNHLSTRPTYISPAPHFSPPLSLAAALLSLWVSH